MFQKWFLKDDGVSFSDKILKGEYFLKDTYEEPVLEVIRFNLDDITYSNSGTGVGSSLGQNTSGEVDE